MKQNNIYKTEYEEYGVKMIALFNTDLISEDEVKDIILEDNFDNRVILITENQFNNVFKDLI